MRLRQPPSEFMNSMNDIRKNEILAIVTMIFYLSGCGQPSTPQLDRDILDKYLKQTNSASKEVANAAVIRILKEDSVKISSIDRIQLAAFFDKINDINQALKQLEIVGDDDKFAALARLNEGRIHFFRTRFAKKAETSLKKSAQLDPTSPAPLTLLASIYDIQNRFKERNDCYIKIDELSAMTRDQLIHWTCDRRPDASLREIAILLDAFVKADPTDTFSLLALVDEFRNRGEFDKANKSIEIILKINLTDSELIKARLSLAETEWDRGNFFEAEKQINQILLGHEKDSLESFRYYRLLSLIQAEAKNYKLAERNLIQAISYKPLDREVNQLMVLVQRLQKKIESVLPYELRLSQIDRLEDLSQKSIATLHRDDPTWLINIAEIANIIGRHDIARAWFRQVLVKDPLNPEIQKRIFQLDQFLKL